MSLMRDILTAICFVGSICLAGVYASGALIQFVQLITDYISR